MAKFFITGGGTGGHIYPAAAVAEALENDEIFYVGNPKNLEYEIITKKGFKFLGVNVHGMPRKIAPSLFKWVFELAFAVIKCFFYIIKYRPDAVFGTGGYVSAPVLIASKILNIPYMMHDCDACPGLVTKKLAKDAKCISTAFENACEVLDNPNCFVNGNPIRPKFKTLLKEDARAELGLENKLTLCITGGSQGAESINNAVIEIIKKLSEDLDLQIIFQTGKKNFEKVAERLKKIYPKYELDKNILIKPYFDDMVTVLKASDIAISRSGSLSISEICASGIAPVFVPYPHAAADHQRKNAQFMVDKGAGLCIEDDVLNHDILYETISSLVEDKTKLSKLKECSLALAKFDALDKIISQLRKII